MSTGLFQDEEEDYNIDEDTKYKLKLDAPESEPAFDVSDDEELDSFEDISGEESEEGGDKPFDDTPFDAGVEADEDEDPEKFIQQLAGKLGTSLRKYNDERGEPDFDLEKYAINSVISASHTSEMDEEDQKDIIRKVKTSGAESDVDSSDDSLGIDDEPNDGEVDDADIDIDIDAEEGDELNEEENPCWDGYEMVGMKMKDGKEVPNCVPKSNESINESREGNTYMFWQNLKTIKHAVEDLLTMDKDKVDALLSDGHGWALDHMATAADDVEEVYHFVSTKYSGEEDKSDNYYGSVEPINEAEYQGKDVELNKPSRGDVKKYKVYVKNDKGNVVKVNFGDKNMEIKRDDPERRKSFRARHKCDNPGPKWKAKYWSCKFWSSTPISDLLSEDLNINQEKSTFDKSELMKDIITAKLHESTETQPVKPKVDPDVKPKSPRRKRIWETKPVVKPKPKMEEDSNNTMVLNGKEVDRSTLSVDGCDSSDYPDFADAYFSYAEFIDGSELNDDELDKLSYEYNDILTDICFQTFV
jgi:hypothetical protein